MKEPLILAHELEHAASDPFTEWVHSLDQLWLRMDHLWKTYPRHRDELISVILQHPKPSLLRIGYGGSEWVLMYQNEPDQTWFAIGDPNAEGNRWVAIPEWSLVDRSCVLSEFDAKRAIAYWSETGEKDPRVQWER
jgi:hypothetical protein